MSAPIRAGLVRHTPDCTPSFCVDHCPARTNDPVDVFGQMLHRRARKPRRAAQPPNASSAAARFGVSASLVRFRDKKDERRCRMCERPDDVRELTEHHVVPLSWYRGSRRSSGLRPLRNAAANKTPLCRPCHDAVETDLDVRRELRRLLSPDEVAFVIQVAGDDWLERRYPSRRPPDALLS